LTVEGLYAKTQSEEVEYASLYSYTKYYVKVHKPQILNKTRMWANAQRNGRPAEYTWRSLFNAAKFG